MRPRPRSTRATRVACRGAAPPGLAASRAAPAPRSPPSSSRLVSMWSNPARAALHVAVPVVPWVLRRVSHHVMRGSRRPEPRLVNCLRRVTAVAAPILAACRPGVDTCVRWHHCVSLLHRRTSMAEPAAVCSPGVLDAAAAGAPAAPPTAPLPPGAAASPPAPCSPFLVGDCRIFCYFLINLVCNWS